jgi:hypothetical protein
MSGMLFSFGVVFSLFSLLKFHLVFTGLEAPPALVPPVQVLPPVQVRVLKALPLPPKFYINFYNFLLFL